MDTLKIKPRSKKELEIKDMCLSCKNFQELAEKVADNMLHHFKRQSFNEPKPESLVEYNKLSKFDKIEYDKKFPNWRRDKGVIDWFDNQSKASSENLSHIVFLRSLLPRLNDQQKNRVLDRISIIQGKKHDSSEIQEAIKTFDGEVK